MVNSYLELRIQGGSRNSEDALKAILEAFDWVGLNYDGEAIYQSKRFDIYKKYINQLLEEGKGYKCYMTKEELDALREEQIEKAVRDQDMIRRYRDFTGTPPSRTSSQFIRIQQHLLDRSNSTSSNDGVNTGKINTLMQLKFDDFYPLQRRDGSPTYQLPLRPQFACLSLNWGLLNANSEEMTNLYHSPKTALSPSLCNCF